ncbi:MAG: helix-hairpin-helix domain-containing protein [Betaproteobacteria bacterium]|nr:helix-hairpin-helix domain-containing protein [Betaproteobacteria bacterium]
MWVVCSNFRRIARANRSFVQPHSPRGTPMKKISTLLAALLIGLSSTAMAQKQEPAKPAAPAAPAAKADAKAAAAPAAPAAKADAKADAKKEPMDLNSATEKELASLPKIGEAKAKAIVKGRPWGGKDELVVKKVLSQAEYDAIKDLIIAKQPEKKEEPKKDAPKKDAAKK